MTVDATVAGLASNSYLDVAAADALAASDLGRNAKAWNAATIEDKEAALIRATAEIDEYVGTVPIVYAAAYLGRGQALLFPRSIDVYGLYDVGPSGTPYIPVRLARATYLQAAHLLRNADLIDDAQSNRARGLVNFANPDGTGGTLSDKADFGRLNDRTVALIGDVSGGVTIGWIESS